tara:strand:+ start:121 stop:1674 length:1554 start_codon:yes stop_codon:yes gene_type:complete
MPSIRTISVSGSIPSITQLALGDLAVNTFDGKAYIKKQQGNTQTIVNIGSGAGGEVTQIIAGTNITISPTSGTGAVTVNASNPVSASYALSSSYALRATSASYAATSSYAKNIIISGSVNNVDYIDFNTGSAVPAWKSGRVFWDNTESCLAVYNEEADITLQVGQENWTRVFNDTGVTIANGAPVRIVGTHGDHPEVVLAQSIQVSGSVAIVNQILGLATHTIGTGTFGYITTLGLVRGLNTNAFNDGDTLYVSSSAGKLTNIPPVAPYELIPVAQVVKASPGASGILYVTPQQPMDFSDLSSAYVTGSYSGGDLWVYNGPQKRWEHTNQLSGSYSITGSLIATSFSGSFTGSLFGTSSFAISSSRAVSSSFSETAASVPVYETSWSSYTPTWTSLGTQPSLVDGTLTGNYKVVGKICFVRVKLTFGNLTTGGTNTWLFGLPFEAITPDALQLPCSIQNSGEDSQWFTGTVSGTYQGITTASAVLVNSSPALPVNATTPFAWGNLDSLQFNGSYEIA